MGVEGLLDYIDESPNSYFAVNNIEKYLVKNGFNQLDYDATWDLKKDGKYYVKIYDSVCVAIVVGSEKVEKEGFKIIAAHGDSPGLKVKPLPEIQIENYIKFNVEPYGGPILHTWFDRPLSFAGKVILRGSKINDTKTLLVNLKRPLLIIPSVAIHLNRNVNEELKINKQVDLLPIIGLIKDELEKENYLLELISQELNVKIEDIIDFDLFIYPWEKALLMGKDNEFISAPRLDDLSMAYAGISSLVKSDSKTGISVMAIFDHEEIGSRSKQGALSPILNNILERITISLGLGREEYFKTLAKSFMISADMAHGIHPNRQEKYDPIIKSKINCGPVIKISANQKYVSDSSDIAVIKQICELLSIPLQTYVNNSNEKGGSTIGPVSSTHLPIRTVDMGASMLAMHSVRELMGTEDYQYMIDIFKEFYELDRS